MNTYLDNPRLLKKIGAIASIVIIGLFLLVALYPFRGAILGSIVLFALFRPLQKTLTRKFKLPRRLAALVVNFVTTLFVILPMTLTIFVVSSEVSKFLSHPEQFQLINLSKVVDPGQHIFGDVKVGDVLAKLDIQNIISSLAQVLQTWLFGILGSVGDIFLQTLILYFFLFYLLINLERLNDILYSISPFNRDNTFRLMVQFRNMTYANVVGTGINAVILGLVLGLGLTLLNVPNPVFWGFMGTIASFVPIVGNSIIWLPIGLYMIATGNVFAGVGIILWGVVVMTLVDNFDRTVINSRLGDTHPIISLLGIFVGIPFFGILGIVLGPMILSYFFLLLKMYKEEYIKDTKMNAGAL
jgi:predicted PurR-regulated permease PerM